MTTRPPAGAHDAELVQRAFDAEWTYLTLRDQREPIGITEYVRELPPDLRTCRQVMLHFDSAERRRCARTGDPPPDHGWFCPFLRESDPAFCQLIEADGPGGALGPLPGEPGSAALVHPHPSRDEDHPGPRLGTVRIVREIGRGGMGVVFEGVDEEEKTDARRRAVKVLPKTAAGDLSRLAKFYLEANASDKLVSEHIVRVRRTGEQSGRPYIVMDYVFGPTLQELFAYQLTKSSPSRPPVRLVADLLCQIASGLEVAHANGVIHRDLTPRNVLLERLLNPDERYPHGWLARICDFGLAQFTDQTRSSPGGGLPPGTPGHWAPEQVDPRKFGSVSGKTDVFALGIIGYQLVTGTNPYHEKGATPWDMAEAIRENRITRPRAKNPGVPEPLDELIWEMLQSHPKGRPSAGQVRKRAEALLAQFEPKAKPKTRRGWLIAAGGAAIASAGAYALWHWWPGGSPPVSSPLRWAALAVVVKRQGPQGVEALEIGSLTAVPVRRGDWITVRAEFTAPAYVYVLWADRKGVSLLYPWNGVELDEEHLPTFRKLPVTEPPPETQPTQTIENPVATGSANGYEVDGTQGLDIILVLVRNTPLPRDHDLNRLTTTTPRREAKPGEWSVTRYEGPNRVFHASNGPHQGPTGKVIPDDDLAWTDEFRQQFNLVGVVTFAHVDKP